MLPNASVFKRMRVTFPLLSVKKKGNAQYLPFFINLFNDLSINRVLRTFLVNEPVLNLCQYQIHDGDNHQC